MKILLCNLGYLLDRQAFLGGYLPSPTAALLGDDSGERDRLSSFVEVLRAEEPDVISLLEVDQGSFRTATDGQCSRIRDRLERDGHAYSMQSFNKYSETGPLRRVPLFRNLAAGLLLRDEAPITPHYLESGFKRLVLETRLANDITLLLAHLSVRKASRQAQLRELATLITERHADSPIVLAGDFNIYDGPDELEPFVERTGLVPQFPGETLVDRPLDGLLTSSKAIDLFLTSPDLPVTETRVAGPAISDHRPAVLSMPA